MGAEKKKSGSTQTMKHQSTDLKLQKALGFSAGPSCENLDSTLQFSHPSFDLIVVVNAAHPHWAQLKASEGVLNYLRHSTYDGVAEWQAVSRASRIDPDTTKILKD